MVTPAPPPWTAETAICCQGSELAQGAVHPGGVFVGLRSGLALLGVEDSAGLGSLGKNSLTLSLTVPLPRK